MTRTSMKLIGNHILASCELKSRNEMMPILFTENTQSEHTPLWMQSSRKFIEKFAPDTTNYTHAHQPARSVPHSKLGRTLFTTVMRIDAKQ
jgi:hypothetical protein